MFVLNLFYFVELLEGAHSHIKKNDNVKFDDDQQGCNGCNIYYHLLRHKIRN